MEICIYDVSVLGPFQSGETYKLKIIYISSVWKKALRQDLSEDGTVHLR